MNNEVNNNGNQVGNNSIGEVNSNINAGTNSIPNINSTNVVNQMNNQQLNSNINSTNVLNQANNQQVNSFDTNMSNNTFNSPNQTQSNNIVNDNQNQFQNNVQTNNGVNFGQNVSTINNNGLYEQNQNSKGKKKNNTIIIIVICLLVLSALGIVFYKLISDYNNPKKRLVVSMKKYLENSNIENDSKLIYEMFKDGFTLGINGDVKANYNQEEILNLSYNFKVIDNPIDSKQYYNLYLNDSEKELINVESLIQDNKIYLMIKDVFNSVYFTDFDYVKLYDDSNELLINNVMTSISDYLTEDKFISTDDTINIDGKNTKVKKISLNITEKMVYEIAVKVLENLKNDDQALKCLVSKDTTLEDLRSDINSSLESLKDSLINATEEDPIIYTTYIKSYNVIKQEIIMGDYSFTITGETKGDIIITSKGETIIKGTYDPNNIKLSVSIDGMDLEIDINSNKTTETNKIKDNYKVDISLKSNADTIILNATMNLEMNNDNSIPNIDISSAKDVNNITEEDQNALLETIMEFPLIKDYFGAFQNAASIDSYSDDYPDYSTDDYYSDDYSSEFNDCDFAFNCVENADGKYSCSYYNDDYELDSIICDKSDTDSY